VLLDGHGNGFFYGEALSKELLGVRVTPSYRSSCSSQVLNGTIRSTVINIWYTALISNSSEDTANQMNICAPLISNSSDEDIQYFAIIRRRLTSIDGLPPLKTCGLA
jgi:hypothetical protein